MLDDVRYIELKSGYADDGPAWIGRVKLSKSGRTLYFNGLALQNWYADRWADVETGLRYGVSRLKKNGWWKATCATPAKKRWTRTAIPSSIWRTTFPSSASISTSTSPKRCERALFFIPGQHLTFPPRKQTGRRCFFDLFFLKFPFQNALRRCIMGANA